MRTAALALLLAARAAAGERALPPPPAGPRLDYAADRVEFDADRSLLHMTGAVTLKESTWTVTGRDLWVDTARRTGRSDAPVLAEDGRSAVYGESGEFDFGRHRGRLRRASAGVANWRVHARQALLREDRRVDYRGANFTSCDRVPPDYHFHASSLSLVPKKRLLAWNTLFFLGPVPLLYTPILYKSLDPQQKLRWKFQFGHDRRLGWHVKSTLVSRLTDSTYSQLFGDYYEKTGFGYGGELDHNAGADSRGSLFGYRIHEGGTTRNRWGFFGDGYRALTRATSVQGRLQLQSDPAFPNDYLRSDVFRLTPELINSAAVTRTLPGGTLRLLYSRDDVGDPANATRFVKNTESAPRVEAQSAAFRLWKTPWLNTVTGFADNSYDRSRAFLQKTVNGTWDARNSFALWRGLTFTPAFTYSETYYNRFDDSIYAPSALDKDLDAFLGRWTASGNLRVKTPLGNIDANHAYTKRLRPDGFTEDTGPADKGVEQNLVALSDVFVPAPRAWARVATGYDLRTFRDHVETFDQRVQPVTTDASWQPSETLIATVHDNFQLGPGKGRDNSVIVDVRWGGERGASVGGGLAYNLAAPSTYYQSLDFSYAPSTGGWRLTVGLRAETASPGGFTRARSLHLFDKEIRWAQRWHDFDTKAIARVRPGNVGELAINVQFRFDASDPQRAERHDWASEWFSGRRTNAERGP